MQAAIARQISNPHRKLRVMPVLLPGAGKPSSDRLPPFLALNTWVEFRDSLDDAAAFSRLVCGVLGVAPGRLRGTDGDPDAIRQLVRQIKDSRGATGRA